jgi:hypothetical protein
MVFFKKLMTRAAFIKKSGNGSYLAEAEQTVP